MPKNNEETLKQKLKESQAYVLEKFCPVIKSKCRIDCACYFKGIIVESVFAGKKEFVLREALCTNVLVDGQVYVNQ